MHKKNIEDIDLLNEILKCLMNSDLRSARDLSINNKEAKNDIISYSTGLFISRDNISLIGKNNLINLMSLYRERIDLKFDLSYNSAVMCLQILLILQLENGALLFNASSI